MLNKHFIIFKVEKESSSVWNKTHSKSDNEYENSRLLNYSTNNKTAFDISKTFNKSLRQKTSNIGTQRKNKAFNIGIIDISDSFFEELSFFKRFEDTLKRNKNNSFINPSN